MAELRAVDIVPVEVASRVLLGAHDADRIIRAWARDTLAEHRRNWGRLKLWMDRQHLNPDQVMQLVVLALYALVTVAEAFAYRRKGR